MMAASSGQVNTGLDPEAADGLRWAKAAGAVRMAHGNVAAGSFGPLVAVASQAGTNHWPKAWHRPPKTVGEPGVSTSSQSPYLDDADGTAE